MAAYFLIFVLLYLDEQVVKTNFTSRYLPPAVQLAMIFLYRPLVTLLLAAH